jgi:hypothetical protein
MLTMMDIRLLIITGMIIIMIAFMAYSYNRDQAMSSKRLVRIPVRTREQRRQAPLPEEETNEVSPTVYYIGFLLTAYLIAMFLMAA